MFYTPDCRGNTHVAQKSELPIDDKGNPTVSNFEDWEKEDIVEYVVQWFNTLYEEPGQEMPYVDGEYLFVYGGPYSALQEIEDTFGDYLSFELMQEISEKIESHGTYDWAPSQYHPDQIAAAEEYLQEYEEWLEQHDPLTIFRVGQQEIQEFVEKHLPEDEMTFIHRMVFMQCWSIFEAFLSDKIIKSAHENQVIIEKLYEKHADLKKLSFSGASLLKDPSVHKKTAMQYLRRHLYHDPKKVISLYTTAFGKLKDADINIQEPMKILTDLVLIRHDCVHRNGKTVEDVQVNLSNEDIKSMLSASLSFALSIEALVTSFEGTQPF